MVAAAIQDESDIQVYPKQEAFVMDDHYSVSFTGGVGSGKTKSGAIRMLRRSQPNCTYMIVAPTYKMMDRATLPAFKSVAEQLGLWTQDYYREQKKEVTLENGAKYLICSSDDPDSLRGPNASGVWCDEMQDAKEDAYTILLGRLREHGKRGWIQATFTPGSPDHWTSKRFVKNCTVEKLTRVMTAFGPVIIKNLVSTDGDVSFYRASLKENTFIEPSFYAGLLKDYAASPMRIRRELEGECVYMEGAEWTSDYFDNVEFNEWPKAKRDAIKVVSLDSSLGKEGKGDDYAAYVKCLWQDGLMYLDADMRPRQDSSVICHTGIEIYKDFNPHYFVVEEELGMHMLISEMHRIADEQKILMAITPMGTEHIKKEVRIRRLTPYISRKQFRFKANSPGAKLLMEQMMAFPLAAHDDGPDSLEYNVRTLILATTGKILPPRVVSYNQMGNAT
jgi:phage terminase large subunit-like protein